MVRNGGVGIPSEIDVKLLHKIWIMVVATGDLKETTRMQSAMTIN
jgi:hypothetical protein